MSQDIRPAEYTLPHRLSFSSIPPLVESYFGGRAKVTQVLISTQVETNTEDIFNLTVWVECYALDFGPCATTDSCMRAKSEDCNINFPAPGISS